MKIIRITLLVAIVFACSSKKDPAPSLEQAKLSLVSSQPITPPTALTSTTDPKAQEANAFIAMANGLSQYTALFTTIPAGATKTTTPIVAVNSGARMAATQQDYLVYVWSDPSYGSIGYQLADLGDKYTFELFFKQTTAGAPWVRYVYAEELKDRSRGLMKIYDPSILRASPPIITYTWTRSGNTFNFEITDNSGLKIVFVYDTVTKAGSISVYENNKLTDKI
ncbi:MAG: hypothetical protein ACKOE6_07305, partial [Flammeovirgaceae bacterium]